MSENTLWNFEEKANAIQSGIDGLLERIGVLLEKMTIKETSHGNLHSNLEGIILELAAIRLQCCKDCAKMVELSKTKSFRGLKTQVILISGQMDFVLIGIDKILDTMKDREFNVENFQGEIFELGLDLKTCERDCNKSCIQLVRLVLDFERILNPPP